jgi:hypothetical protein
MVSSLTTRYQDSAHVFFSKVFFFSEVYKNAKSLCFTLISLLLCFKVYCLDFQEKNIRFNRALLMNVGFVEAMKQYDYQCFIFHDVDLLPEDDRNLYTCPQFPRHMSVAIDRLQYK